MEILPTRLAGAFEIRLQVHGDARGQFKRHFCARRFAEAGLVTEFVQMNHSISLGQGTLRGLHYQLQHSAEAKLVSCTYGRVFDVAVDLRPASPTFLQWQALELDQGNAFYIPPGCAHGFQCLTDEAHIVYLLSAFYDPERERGMRHDDPRLGIAWPLPAINLSDRDRVFADIGDDFEGVLL